MRRNLFYAALLLGATSSIVAAMSLSANEGGDYSRRMGEITTEKGNDLRAADDVKSVYGCIMSANDWSQFDIPQYAIWSFPLANSEYVDFTQMSNYGVNANGGGVAIDNVYHCVETSINPYTDERLTYYNTYNVRNWSQTSRARVSDGLIATDLTYDPTTNIIYGCFYTDDMKGYELATVDFTLGLKRRIIDLGTGHFIGLAVSPQGQMYGISWDSKLYKINKKNGEMTLVGPIGITFDRSRQTAFFDEETGKMYFSGLIDNNTSGLYSINLETGAASLMAAYPHAEQLVGAFIPKPSPSKDAPYKVSSLKASFTGESTTGSISFTLPDETVDGADLKGNVSYEVIANGLTKAEGDGKAGSKVTCDNITVESGQVKIVVVCSNAAGRGQEAVLITYIGSDEPLAPENVNLRITDGGEATITWNTPTKGTHDKDIEAENLTYSIVRYPDGKKVAQGIAGNSFKDNIESPIINKYYYMVTPFNKEVEGMSAISNTVIYGQYLETPYSQNFDGEDALDFFTIVNTNGDAASWGVDSEGHAVYTSLFAQGAADDWLITPPLHLFADRSYVFSFTASGRVALGVSANDETFEVYYGKGRTAAAMTQPILQNGIANSFNFKSYSFVVRPESDGDYSIGFHVTTPKAQSGSKLMLDDIVFDLNAMNDAPDAVSGLTVTPAPFGDKKATVSFTTPEKNSAGDTLSGITKVEVARGEMLVKSFEAPAMGASLSFEDEGMDNGISRYTVTAYNEAGKGVSASAEAFIGVDQPLPPSNVVLRETGDDEVTVSWTPPTVGVNGGYVNPDRLTYRVQRSDNTWMTMSQVGATGFVSDESSVHLSWPQAGLFYHVHASNEAGESGRGTSNTIMIGNPYRLPYLESFKTGFTDNSGWSNIGKGNFGQYYTDGLSSDGDGHCALFKPSKETGTAEYVSSKITLEGVVQPGLRFHYYAYPGQDASLVVSYQKNADNDITVPLADLNFKDMQGEEGWRDTTVYIDGAEDARYIRIHFAADCRDGKTPVAFDDIQVREMVPYNVQAQLASPRYVRAGEDNNFYVKVINLGTQDASGFTVRLYADGEEVASCKGAKIEVGKDETYTLAWKPELTDAGVRQMKAEAEYNYDADKDDNITPEIAVMVEHSAYPVVTLQGTLTDSEVELSWTAPEIQKGRVTDDFEDYSMDDIYNFGNWATFDGDGGGTWTIREFGDFPGSGFEMAWILFNAENGDGKVTAHSGNQFLFTVSSNYMDAIVNANWLMSPQLTGDEQEIEFWYRVLDTTIPERIRILYSLNSNHYEDFIELEAANELTNKEWMKYTFTVPEGAKFFAIEYVTPTLSPDGFAMMLDDISYEGIGSNLEVTGYAVYRDGAKVATLGNDKTAWSDALSDSLDHTYKVAVLYNLGESTYSNEFSTKQSGVNSYGDGTLRVMAGYGEISVTGTEGRDVTVYSVDGRVVYQGAGDTTVKVEPSCYIVKAGRRSVKVIVK